MDLRRGFHWAFFFGESNPERALQGALLSDAYRSLGSHCAVELLRLIGHGYGQFFLHTFQFEIVWYTPRVPAGACSAKGHDALGHHLAIGPGNDDFGIERLGTLVAASTGAFLFDLHGCIIQTPDHDVQFRIN